MAHWRSMMESKWLTSMDLTADDGTTRDAAVVIEKVEGGEVENEAGKKKKPVLHFVGKKKPLACGVTICKAIQGMYGPDTNGWVGKGITLYVTETSMKGETVPCVRVRPVPPAAHGRARQQPVPGTGG